jgi:hypothetical protein
MNRFGTLPFEQRPYSTSPIEIAGAELQAVAADGRRYRASPGSRPVFPSEVIYRAGDCYDSTNHLPWIPYYMYLLYIY